MLHTATWMNHRNLLLKKKSNTIIHHFYKAKSEAHNILYKNMYVYIHTYMYTYIYVHMQGIDIYTRNEMKIQNQNRHSSARDC